MGTGGDLSAVPVAHAGCIPCDPGIWREPSRADSKFSRKSYPQRTMNGYLAVQRIVHVVRGHERSAAGVWRVEWIQWLDHRYRSIYSVMIYSSVQAIATPNAAMLSDAPPRSHGGAHARALLRAAQQSCHCRQRRAAELLPLVVPAAVWALAQLGEARAVPGMQSPAVPLMAA